VPLFSSLALPEEIEEFSSSGVLTAGSSPHAVIAKQKHNARQSVNALISQLRFIIFPFLKYWADFSALFMLRRLPPQGEADAFEKTAIYARRFFVK
jgi:hypothetical protein